MVVNAWRLFSVALSCPSIFLVVLFGFLNRGYSTTRVADVWSFCPYQGAVDAMANNCTSLRHLTFRSVSRALLRHMTATSPRLSPHLVVLMVRLSLPQMLISPAFLSRLVHLSGEPKQNNLLVPLLQHLCWRNKVSVVELSYTAWYTRQATYTELLYRVARMLVFL